MTNVELADEVGLSPSPCLRRVRAGEGRRHSGLSCEPGPRRPQSWIDGFRQRQNRAPSGRFCRSLQRGGRRTARCDFMPSCLRRG
ncbi:winged helix-turn-helix transcriptional regulator [Agrobacterium cavarae]|uniref:winged helix-turn-helix transcriptional regulator n=1 Tax=Agrobacterium cavarae TaxID=2528239 RepID=UPI0035E404DA